MKVKRSQLITHVKHATIALGPDLANLNFSDAKKLLSDLVEQDRLSLHLSGWTSEPKVDLDRYTAMILSYVKGNTTDEDAIWHIY